MKIFLKVLVSVYLFSVSLSADITISYDQSSVIHQNNPTPEQKVDIKKIKKIAQEKNIKVIFKSVPWRRALLMLEKGLLDGTMNGSYNESRAKFAVYPTNNGKLDNSKRLNDGNTYYIYRHIDSPLRWNGKKFLQGGKVGVKEKYAVIGDLKKYSNITIEEYIQNSKLIRMLSSNKIDGYAGSSEEANRLIKKYIKFSKTIVKEPLPIRKKEYFLLFSKKTYIQKSKEMEQIWLGLQQVNIQK